VRGAFSGAHSDRAGKFQAADEGTLFLDEIGDMDVRLQAKLLRVLQEGVIEPLGANRRIAVDVRIVSSTNRDLQRAMLDGRFREDLYFRLNVFEVKLPPLRERQEDIEALAEAFLAGFARDLGKPTLRLASEAVNVLQGYGGLGMYASCAISWNALPCSVRAKSPLLPLSVHFCPWRPRSRTRI